jgi:hypothetical protein
MRTQRTDVSRKHHDGDAEKNVSDTTKKRQFKAFEFTLLDA